MDKSEYTIANRTWKLKKLGSYSEGILNAFHVTIAFNFEKEKVYGKCFCNQFGGKFILNANKIKFREIISTQMACEELHIEHYFFHCLQDLIDSFTVNQHELCFYKNQDLLMIFVEK